MAEPDFEQILARFVRSLAPGGDLYGTRLTADVLVEQLRQVWNARGAADLAACEEDRAFELQAHPSLGPYYASFVAHAIRKLDR